MQTRDIEQINVKTKEEYRVIIGRNISIKASEYLKKNRRLAVTDSNVYNFYKDYFESFLERKDDVLVFNAGEESKNYKTLHKIYDFLIKKSADRYTFLAAVGGGVVGDVAGFAASTYMRGMPLMQIPTSLLAMVDSSVGGKTAINYGHYKNIIGSFYQPKLVLCDVDFLNTLPKREYLSALAEVVKYGIIQDASFFEFLEKNMYKIKDRDMDLLKELVARSVKNKVKIVEKDEKEKGQRALLNFGHTLAHALESITNYLEYLHGEAVSIGEVFAAVLSSRVGLIDNNTVERIKSLLEFFELPTYIDKDFSSEKLYKIMEMDKKNKGGVLSFILTKNIGSSIISSDLHRSKILDAIDEIKG